jgi:phosphoglycolate phosphatase-like HAD superfamily hydrolase
MIWLAMRQTGVQASQSVAKIGDSAIDIEEGRNAGCGMTFGVTTGAQTEKQLRSAAPTYVVESLGEMFDLIMAAKSENEIDHHQ